MFWIILRHVKRFLDVVNAKSTFKIMKLGGNVFRIGFFLNYKITTTKKSKNYTGQSKKGEERDIAYKVFFFSNLIFDKFL